MIIYKVKNKINNKIYIGQTIRKLNKRISSYKCAMRNKTNTYYFMQALRKYGIEGFDWEIIHYADSQEELNNMEDFWIKFYISNDRYYGYNSKTSGNKCVFNDNTKEKMSQSAKNSFKNGRKVWNEGKLPSKHVAEILGKYSFKKNHIPWIKGKHLSDKLKEKLSKAHIGIPSKIRKKVICIETKKIYLSATEAALEFSVKVNSIARVCRGERKTYKGFHFQYLSDYEKLQETKEPNLCPPLKPIP